MRHWPTLVLAAACFLAPVTLAHAQDDADYTDYITEGYGALDKTGSKRLLDVISNVDALLGADAPHYLGPVAKFMDQQFYLTGAPQLDGLIVVDLDRRPDFPAATILSLNFASDDLRDSFHAALVGIFGEPDQSCYSDTSSNWPLEPGRSISWRSQELGTPVADLTIRATDPIDANCSRSSSPQTALVNENHMSDFLQRLLDEPVPFGDLAAMQQWLAPYGGMDSYDGDKCFAMVTMPSSDTDGLSNLDGIAAIVANVQPCKDTEGLSYLSLSSTVDQDMYARERFIQFADGVLGERVQSCSDDLQDVWRIDDDTTLILSDSYLSFVAMVYHAPPNMLGCT